LLAGDAHGFEDLLEAWAVNVKGAVASGEFGVAAGWLDAVLADPTYPPERAAAVGAAFEALSRPEVLDDTLVSLAASESREGGPELVAAWGSPLTDHMVDLMAVADPPVGRRRLVEFLGWAGRADIRLLVAHLDDPRWFVARNLAIALGRTRRSPAVAALERLAEHPEARVRVEALRSLASLGAEGTLARVASGLSDRSSRVRDAALTLLRANPDPAVVAALVTALESARVDVEQARRLVSAIAERRHDGVAEALERIAGRRFAIRASRAARDAARIALRSRRPGRAAR
jgi:hypothetical protein